MPTSIHFHARDEPVVLAGPQWWRVAVIIVVFIGLFAAIGTRLHDLQVDQAERLSGLRDRQIHRKWDLQAARGSIIDAQGAPLAADIGTWTVYADAGYMNDRLRATVALSAALDVPRDELRRQFETRSNGRRLSHGLDDATADRVRAVIEDDKLSGIYVRREFTRTYPAGRLAAHLVGFLGDGRGGAGIEQSCEARLASVGGFETVAMDAHNRPFVLGGSESRAARPGANVQLTIDSTLQRELEAALSAAVEKHQPKIAAGILLRPATGEILALASWPDFDPAERSRMPAEHLRNNVLAFVYEPGSTMKPLIAGAAVVDGLAQWDERIDCEKGAWTYRAGKAARTIHEKSGGHGVLSLVECISLSDNIAMAKLGIRLGPERLFGWIQQLNFGRDTGIALPGEDGGLVLPRARWSVIGSCMSVPMGHEIAVTPIQMAMAHAAVANGGVWLPPRLVRRIWTPDGEGSASELPLPMLPAARRIYAPSDAARIQAAMNRTMEDGTGKRSALDGYSSAGKTGTSEKLVGGQYSAEHNVGSFVCWAPAAPERMPELLCLVVIDDPSQNGRFGSETAAPVVQRVLQFSLAHLGVPREPDFEKPAPTVGKPGVRIASPRRRP